MRLRGAFAGPEQIHVVDQDRRLALAVPDNRTINADLVRAALAGPVTDRATGVGVGAPDHYSDLALWLALHEPRWCGVSEWDSAVPACLPAAPLRIQDQRITAGILDDDSLAVLGQEVPGGELSVIGYGPDGGALADQLAARVRGWDAAGRPATEGLRIDAYPRSTPDDDLSGPLVIDKVHTRLALTWAR
jgi:protein-L-isoaspartate(D-aspartate) O-methyltransferase